MAETKKFSLNHEENFQSVNDNNEIKENKNYEIIFEEKKDNQRTDLITNDINNNFILQDEILNINNNDGNSNLIERIINNAADSPLFKSDPDELKNNFKRKKKNIVFRKFHKDENGHEKFFPFFEDYKENLGFLCESEGSQEGYNIINFKEMMKKEKI